MKYAGWMVCALFVAFGCSARATMIDLNSNSTAADPRQTNNLTAANVLITPHPAWNPNGAGLWISYADTGNGGAVSPPNVLDPITGPDANAPTAVFYLTFTLPYDYNSGSITVWADDTASVWLDVPSADADAAPVHETLLIDADPVQGSACADAPVSCSPGGGAKLSLNGLTQGVHTIEIDAYQRGGGPFGVQYEGSIDSEEAPEPATCVPFAAGLAVLYWWRWRRALAVA